MAMAEVGIVLPRTRKLGIETGAVSNEPVLLFGDNVAALRWTEPDNTRTSRHIEFKYYHSRKLNARNLVAQKYVKTSRNIEISSQKFYQFARTLVIADKSELMNLQKD